MSIGCVMTEAATVRKASARGGASHTKAKDAGQTKTLGSTGSQRLDDCTERPEAPSTILRRPRSQGRDPSCSRHSVRERRTGSQHRFPCGDPREDHRSSCDSRLRVARRSHRCATCHDGLSVRRDPQPQLRRNARSGANAAPHLREVRLTGWPCNGEDRADLDLRPPNPVEGSNSSRQRLKRPGLREPVIRPVTRRTILSVWGPLARVADASAAPPGSRG
jgi:hypothetical protein